MIPGRYWGPKRGLNFNIEILGGKDFKNLSFVKNNSATICEIIMQVLFFFTRVKKSLVLIIQR